MTTTLEQTQSDLLKLVQLVQQGEEVVITDQGRAVAKLSAIPGGAPSSNRQAWLERLRQLREHTSTGKLTTSADDLLEDLRSERV